ncbi:MAG: hypothetical protein WC455_25485 [Dehalococcoidia bacterium]|jgi:hypothetical protein
MSQNMDGTGLAGNRSAEMDGLKQQRVLLATLSKKLDEYFSLPTLAGKEWREDSWR